MLITGEPHLRDGLSWSGVAWAFTAIRSSGSRHVDYVSPLTLLSRLLDVQLFGFDPAAYHLVNLLFHAVHVVLAFLVLEALTGGFWPSAFVAALLAVHPLHVESVAWVTERKDVLSGVFWWLTVGAYVRYVRQPGTGRRAAVAILYVMALMAKPMVVTLPFVLLLFDYWPLGRLRPEEPGLAGRARQLLTEKADRERRPLVRRLCRPVLLAPSAGGPLSLRVAPAGLAGRKRPRSPYCSGRSSRSAVADRGSTSSWAS